MKITINPYIEALKKNLNDEIEAIKGYDELLNIPNLPQSTINIISEIRNDEKDHLVILNALLEDELEVVMPDNGIDELEEYGLREDDENAE